MKSLYVGVLLAAVATLLLSLVVFIVISNHLQREHLYPVFEAMDELELETARAALKNGGASALAAYLGRLDRLFGATHYLLNAGGIDVVSGRNQSAWLPLSPSRKSRGDQTGRFIVTHESLDGNYWFVAVNTRQPNRWTFFPYYILVIGATGILCWITAIGVVSPIRKIAATVEQFSGDLSTRVNMRRRDEIGGLARSFNGMADRIQTLIVSERMLLEDISHELRSPLTRLKFAVRLARTAVNPSAALDRVDREVDRITSLVSEIVELTRVEGDPLAHRFEPVRMDEVIAEIVSGCRLEAEIRGCSIEVEGQIGRSVSGNRELLRRAMENVLRNAIRYSPEEASVDVVLTESSETATVTIRDYGPGVPEASLSRIFEPFFRVEESRDSESGGIGLGLSIAKRAVQLHGGRIEARNAHVGLIVQIVIPMSVSTSPC